MRIQRKVLIGISVFCAAIGVRLLSWSDNCLEALRVEWVVTAANYKPAARLLLEGNFAAFLRDPGAMTHPPGYPVLLALIAKLFGSSDTAIQFVQIAADALAAVVVYLIAAELLPETAAVIAGAMAAVSPQLSYYPLLLLPDSLTVLPILLAVYALVRAYKHPRLPTLLLAGALVGISCWLRANALLLALFLAAAAWILLPRNLRLRGAATVVLGWLLVIAPITINNAIVFRQLIPLSLGAGQKLLQGIAEYDTATRFGIPKTDVGIVRQEAEMYHRPEYAAGLFNVDGPLRDRLRVARAAAVIESHPVWYAGVMLRRAGSFWRLAQVPIALPEQSPRHATEVPAGSAAAWTGAPAELILRSTLAGAAKISLDADGRELLLVGDSSKYGEQIATAAIAVRPGTDYLSRIPVTLEQGRMFVDVVSTEDKKTLASMVVDPDEGVPPGQQLEKTLGMPFASGDATGVSVIVRNGAQTPQARLGAMSLFELGPTAYLWTRWPRLIVRNVQRFFLTAWMLPLELLGIGLLAQKRQGRALAILLAVPVYYMCVESAVHTERRYVIAIHYFLLILAAAALGFAADFARRKLRGRAAAAHVVDAAT